jgi:WS/DGAT/MGAT family acyltransferase
MQRLSGQDASFLYLETPTAHMHIAGIGILEPGEAGTRFSFEEVLELVAERLHLVPSTRWRLAEVPFGLHHPLWVDDPAFDLEYHVRRAALPSPAGMRELCSFAADVTSRPLDRRRPLWEMYVIEGFEGDKLAVISKTHHAAIDGVGGVNMTVAMMDLSPEPTRSPPPAWTPEAVPSEADRLRWAAMSLARQPLAMARASVSAGRSAIELLTRQRRSDGHAAPPAPFSAPRTSINVSLSPHRQFAGCDVGLADVKAVKNALGGTVNDVVLALCSGALRSYFANRGERVDAPLVALVPISVRADASSTGNQISSMLVSLASDVEDAAERLATIAVGTRGAKEQHQALGAETMGTWQEFAVPVLAARAARMYSTMRLADRLRPPYNLTISNVPGPPFPLYSFGAKALASYPMGPVQEGVALNITVSSYLDRMFFGIHACREAVDDVWFIADAIERELAVLTSAAAGAG